METAELVETIRQARAVIDVAWPDPSENPMVSAETKITAAMVRANLVVTVALKLMSDRSPLERPDHLKPRCAECLEKSVRCVDCGKPVYPFLPRSERH